MYELIYSSLAKPGTSANDISEILEISQKYNLDNAITGCLLFYNNEFIQILEGDEKNVIDLFEKIKKDKRHTNVNLIGKSQKKERDFFDWSMAYRKFDSEESEYISDFLFVNNLLAISELTAKSTKVTRLFWHLVKKLLEEKK